MNNSQLLKGTLEGCVLLVISQQEVYGYELVTRLQNLGFFDLRAGTVYPLLQKLERQGYLESQLRASTEGPKRKDYLLTTSGQLETQHFITDWQQLIASVCAVIEQTGENMDGANERTK